MKRVRVYQNNLLIVGESIELNKDNQKYLKKVLRLKNGFELVVFNGDGFDYQAILENTQLNIISSNINNNELTTNITLVQSIAKHDKMDFIIQKAVELGIKKITPIITKRVIVKLDEKKKLNRQLHWQKVAISATEQCGRSIVPKIDFPISFNEYLKNNTTNSFVLHHLAKKTLQEYPITTDINIVIGPEGGLTDDEIEQLEKNNHQALLLGKTVLRTETASISAVSLLSLLWQ
ncbi:Ribosomal RNA small subunit methyltransferase E [hydrothermal vent metagenome]|uniref:16S rRNA (uracil(1498)-N(3))-methyltransferase n=1 Tax=hydrothermal vent metagenome TaxID=652676 RepID=A0A1W1BHF2_9ZZZZ